MDLTSSQKKAIRGIAQRLDPAVQVGKSGLTENALKEIDRALSHDEVVKIRFGGIERQERQIFCDEISRRTGATLCGQVGSTASFYRQNPEPEQRVIKW